MSFGRRTLLQIAAASVSMHGVGLAKDAPQYSDKDEADRWVQDWMLSTKAAHGALHLLRFSDGMYALTRNIGWTPNDTRTGLRPVAVVAGFITDFASIPRVFWSMLPKDGRYTYAAIIHDYLYWTQTTTREVADEVFREVMSDFKVGAIAQTAIYNAVRLGGGAAWDENKRLRELGERRVIKRLPADPTVSWALWKLDNENF